jgi:hypothetical protein
MARSSATGDMNSPPVATSPLQLSRGPFMWTPSPPRRLHTPRLHSVIEREHGPESPQRRIVLYKSGREGVGSGRGGNGGQSGLPRLLMLRLGYPTE